MAKLILWIFFAVAIAGTIPSRAAGPTSELFLTLDFNRLVALKGTAVTVDTPLNPQGVGQSPVAVIGTVRTLGTHLGEAGSEYTLGGTPTGVTYAFPFVSNSIDIYDGTTDGTFNYAWDYSNGVAYRFGLDWKNPQTLFTLGAATGSRAGITYDPTNNSLWIAGFDGSIALSMEDYSLTGTLLSSFKITHGFTEALALDPADGTLWLANTNATILTLEQYSRSVPGNFGLTQPPLNTQTYSQFMTNTVGGGEFRYTGIVVPEPGGYALMVLGWGLLATYRRRSAFSA